MELQNLVQFRGDKLFNGAVNIDWYLSDPEKAQLASESFLFHGPDYHGVSQEEVGYDHGHALIDTADFARLVMKRAYGLDHTAFTLAIAGYGTGKSHLGLTLANLLRYPTSKVGKGIIARIRSADETIGHEMEVMVKEISQPCLVIALNGLQGFDFVFELSRQLSIILESDGHDAKAIRDLRPRFKLMVSLIRNLNSDLQNSLLSECAVNSIDQIFEKLEQQDEDIYRQSYEFLLTKDLPMRNLQNESVKDLIGLAVQEYCGENKPYRSIIILFDEFGKYAEFATSQSHRAGHGVLQDLFEAVQAYAPNVCMVGFIQFELNAYLQRIAPEFKNEMQRYVTRYQTSNKLYLSTNLETLIANLIEKKDTEFLSHCFDNDSARHQSLEAQKRINRWFPNSRTINIWQNSKLFHKIIREGAWPLSPYAVWLLYYLTAVGGHLQERSALALLLDAFMLLDTSIEITNQEWDLAAVDLFTDSLCNELLSSEDIGNQGSIMQGYQTVTNRYPNKFNLEQIKVLRAIVLSAKLGLVASSREEVISALATLSNVHEDNVNKVIQLFQDEYNVIEWDEADKSFDILGDALPRSQFIHYLRRQSANFDESSRSQLYVSTIQTQCDLIQGIDCDFAEESKITTLEWQFKAEVANLNTIDKQIDNAVTRWGDAQDFNEPRGTIIYTYVGENSDLELVKLNAKSLLKNKANSIGIKALPVLLLFLHDKDAILGKCLVELSILASPSADDRLKYGNMIEAHVSKTQREINEIVNSMLRERIYVAYTQTDIAGSRISKACTEIFKSIYSSPIPFPFDGFSTTHGNAADTCSTLIRELLHGTLDHDSIMSKSAKDKNRANSVLVESWSVFSRDGKINSRPSNSILNKITITWDDKLRKNSKLSLKEMFQTLIKPPFGANTDSSGLFLSVYISPRLDRFMILKGDSLFTVREWAETNLVRNRHFNPVILENAYIVRHSDDSSEWILLLDEWEKCLDHTSRESCYLRSEDLKKRLPVPSTKTYLEERLRDQALESIKQLKSMKDSVNKARNQIGRSEINQDFIELTKSCVVLKELMEKFDHDQDLWLEKQVEDVREIYATARQEIMRFFPSWLPRQTPKSGRPVDVGEFKALMLNTVGVNLDKIGLDTLKSQLQTHVNNMVRDSETAAEAHQVIQDVSNWLQQSVSILETTRIKDVRSAKHVAQDYKRKLRGLYQRIKLNELLVLRSSVHERLVELLKIEKNIGDKARIVWSTKITDEDSINALNEILDSIILAYEGIAEDCEDFHLQARALRLYKTAFGRLNDPNMNWNAFNALASAIKDELITAMGEEEIPWPPEDTIKAIVKFISDTRKQLSKEWTNSILQTEFEIPSMEVSNANQLHIQISKLPAFVTEADIKKIDKLKKILEKRLNDLNIEWLVEKYKELSEKDKKHFLAIIASMFNKELS